MNTEIIAQPGNYDFAAAPQPIGAKGKYREPSESGGVFQGEQPNRSQNGNSRGEGGQFDQSEEGFQQSGGYSNFYEPLDEEGEDENQIQPDFYVDRPKTPEFKPKEKGVDVETQIIDNELFDFQLEVEPILQVLVGKTVDQARMELIEEFEKEEFKKHKAQYEIKRNAELMVTQRMEAAYLRREEEKARREKQHVINQEQQKFAHKKLLSRQLVKRALCDLKRTCLGDLENVGFLRDQMILKLRANFLPWIFEQFLEEQSSEEMISKQLEELAKEVQENVASDHQQSIEKEKLRRQEILNQREILRLKKEERKRKKAEWQRKIQLNQDRQKILDQIYEQIIIKAEKHENPRDCDFTDINSDGKKASITPVFGGLIGQLWIAIQAANSQLIENPLTNAQIEGIVEGILKDFKIGIAVKLSESQREFYENQVKILSEVTENLVEAREEFVRAILENEALLFTENNTLQFLRNILEAKGGQKEKEIEEEQKEDGQENTQQQSQIDGQAGENNGDQSKTGESPKQQQQQNHQATIETLKFILKILLNHQAKQIKPDHVDESKPKEEQEEKTLGSKIRLFFEDTANDLRNKINVILRLHTPFMTQAELERRAQLALEKLNETNKSVPSNSNSNKQQSQNNSINQPSQNNSINQPSQNNSITQNEQPEDPKQAEQPKQEEIMPIQEAIEQPDQEEKCKYDEFVNVFDGEGFQRELAIQLAHSERRPLAEDFAAGFFLNIQDDRRILLLDERIHFYLQAVLYQKIREIIGGKVDPMNPAVFLEYFDDIQENVQSNFLASIYDDETIKGIPVFDAEFGFNSPSE